MVKVIKAGGGERELVLAFGGASADTDVLVGLEKQPDSGKPCGLLPETGDDCLRAVLALFRWFLGVMNVMRLVFTAGGAPPPLPTNEPRVSTAGSSSTIWQTWV